MVPERVRGPGIPAVQAAARWCLQHPTQASKPCSRVAIQRQFRKASTPPALQTAKLLMDTPMDIRADVKGCRSSGEMSA